MVRCIFHHARVGYTACHCYKKTKKKQPSTFRGVSVAACLAVSVTKADKHANHLN